MCKTLLIRDAVRTLLIPVLLLLACGLFLYYIQPSRDTHTQSGSSKSPLQYQCNDVMTNLTNGRWMHWKNFVSDPESAEFKRLEMEEKQFHEHMTEFRIKRGIHTRLWRDDLKCGLVNKQTKPKVNAWGGSVGAWCDAKSEHPCCSNENNGICGMTCDCERCIDMRKIVHAEFAKWVPNDARCSWKNYTAEEACKVVNKFSEIHIVGDSFIRKMGRVMMLMLRGDRSYGVTVKKHNEEMRKKCVADDQLYWTECLLDTGTYKELLVDESPLCGMDLSKFVLHSHYGYDAGEKALKLVKRLSGIPGSLILLGVGGHFSCNTGEVIKAIISPLLPYLKPHGKVNATFTKFPLRWPMVIFTFPDTPDVLKSPDYRAANGKVPCYRFSDQMIVHLTNVGIPYLDFRKVTSDVHSYDGTHHGIGVNIIKLQILFNYLESLQWFFNDKGDSNL